MTTIPKRRRKTLTATTSLTNDENIPMNDTPENTPKGKESRKSSKSKTTLSSILGESDRTLNWTGSALASEEWNQYDVVAEEDIESVEEVVGIELNPPTSDVVYNEDLEETRFISSSRDLEVATPIVKSHRASSSLLPPPSSHSRQTRSPSTQPRFGAPLHSPQVLSQRRSSLAAPSSSSHSLLASSSYSASKPSTSKLKQSPSKSTKPPAARRKRRSTITKIPATPSETLYEAPSTPESDTEDPLLLRGGEWTRGKGEGKPRRSRSTAESYSNSSRGGSHSRDHSREVGAQTGRREEWWKYSGRGESWAREDETGRERGMFQPNGEYAEEEEDMGGMGMLNFDAFDDGDDEEEENEDSILKHRVVRPISSILTADVEEEATEALEVEEGLFEDEIATEEMQMEEMEVEELLSEDEEEEMIETSGRDYIVPVAFSSPSVTSIHPQSKRLSSPAPPTRSATPTSASTSVQRERSSSVASVAEEGEMHMFYVKAEHEACVEVGFHDEEDEEEEQAEEEREEEELEEEEGQEDAQRLAAVEPQRPFTPVLPTPHRPRATPSRQFVDQASPLDAFSSPVRLPAILSTQSIAVNGYKAAARAVEILEAEEEVMEAAERRSRSRSRSQATFIDGSSSPSRSISPSTSIIAVEATSPYSRSRRATSVPANTSSSWSVQDWRRLDDSLIDEKRLARREAREIRIDDIVQGFLRGEGLELDECEGEWKWEKLHTRVMALMQRRAQDKAATGLLNRTLDQELMRCDETAREERNQVQPLDHRVVEEEEEEEEEDEEQSLNAEDDTFFEHRRQDPEPYQMPLPLFARQLSHLHDEWIEKPKLPAGTYPESLMEDEGEEGVKVVATAKRWIRYITSLVGVSSVSRRIEQEEEEGEDCVDQDHSFASSTTSITSEESVTSALRPSAPSSFDQSGTSFSSISTRSARTNPLLSDEVLREVRASLKSPPTVAALSSNFAPTMKRMASQEDLRKTGRRKV